jgi:carboxypeptidase C (cathepsin A)
VVRNPIFVDKMRTSIAVFSLFAGVVVSQFVTPPTDLKNATGYAGVNVRYKQVPTGVCEVDPNVKSFSGYADVAENEHIFWWFFESRTTAPEDAPLTVWINGGPGSSSMIGLFQELGPCSIDSNGEVVNNPYSWSTVSNLLIIDQPTQTGFSYSIPIPGYTDSNGYVIPLTNGSCPSDPSLAATCGTYSNPDQSLTANSTSAAAPNFWKTLQGFMGVFPQYSRESFHFTSESYGGHYGPVFNTYIEDQNANLPSGAQKIKLESVMIGNGWFDPILQYPAYYNFTVYPGNTYDYKPYNSSIEDQLYNATFGPGNCVDRLKKCAAGASNDYCSEADSYCAARVENTLDVVANRDEYDSRELRPDPFPYEYYVQYLNTPAVQAAIGAFQTFTEGSNAVGDAFGTTGDDGREAGTVEDMRRLFDDGIRVVMYFGDADYNCNWLGGQAVAEELNATGFNTAGFVNISTSDGVVHGQVKQSGLYAFVRIYESGHEVPFYQPLASLELFERVLNGKDIATGKLNLTSGYKTVGPKASTYREGISTVQFEVVPTNSTYNTTTNMPNLPASAFQGQQSKGLLSALSRNRQSNSRRTKPQFRKSGAHGKS